MRGHISNHAATVAEVLRDEGYATFALGKWHLAPMERVLGRRAVRPVAAAAAGFDRFYGFLDGETDQFHPELVYDNHPIDPPAGPEDGYHLSEDLVDQRAADDRHDSKGVRPDRPFFAYLAVRRHPRAAPGAAPSTSPSTAARFDEGWDVVRERWFARQLELGRDPRGHRAGAAQPGRRAVGRPAREPAAAGLPACRRRSPRSSTTPTTRSAGSSTGCAALGELDNTIVVVLADNGASQEGGPFGVMHEMKFFNGILETPDEAIERIDDIGGPHSHTNYPWGWAQAGNTPFKWYKQNTHEGGVHVPLIVHWPDGIAADQRGHDARPVLNVADIAPTIYELLGVTPPERVPRARAAAGHRPLVRYTSRRRRPRRPPTPCSTSRWRAAGRSYAGGWKAVCKHQPGRRLRRRAVGAVPPRRATAPSATTSRPSSPSKLAELVAAVVGRGRAPRRAARSTTA